ncbi:MAG: hypothetical protein ACLR7U_02780 [Ruthenibacterium lactatiformans]
MRRLGINFTSVISVSVRRALLDTTSGFRACNKELTAYFADHYAQDYPEPEAIITAVLNGYRVAKPRSSWKSAWAANVHQPF